MFSLLLALVFACIVWVVGHPAAESDLTTVVGYVQAGSPAAKAGLLPGDKILEVDGEPVIKFSGMTDSVVWNVVRSEGATIPFKIERAGEIKEFSVEPYKAETRGWRRKSVRQVMIMPAQTAIVDEVVRDSPAAAAGLVHSDVVTRFNDMPIYNPQVVADYIDQHPSEPITLQVTRGQESLQPTLQPRILFKEEKKPRLGIVWDADGKMSVAHPNPIEQVYKSITGTLNTIGAVASPKSEVKLQHMSGPVLIVHIY